MKEIIEELKYRAKCEMENIGATPRTNFYGTQKDHDDLCRERAKKLRIAAELLDGFREPLLDAFKEGFAAATDCLVAANQSVKKHNALP